MRKVTEGAAAWMPANLGQPTTKGERMRARTRLACILVATVALVAASCTGGDQSDGEQGDDQATGETSQIPSGGVLRVGTLQFPDSINPFNSFSADGQTVIHYIYPTLVDYDTRDNSIVPNFATSWEESEDGLTWTFHTIADAQWSDGQPLTARDVEWTINTIVKYRAGASGGLSDNVPAVESAEAIDDTTVVLHLENRVSYLLAALQRAAILPQHVWEQFATGDGAELQAQTNIPVEGEPIVSGGPFMVTEFTPHDIVLLSVNPNWYGQMPHIEGWGMQFFSESAAALQALQNGDIDYINGYLPPTAIAPMEEQGFEIIAADNVEQLYFDVNSQHSADHPELGDPLVREAFAHAINQQEIIDTAYLGYANPSASLLAVAHGNVPGTDLPWTDPTLEVHSFDLDLANDLLDQAGYEMGPDGIRIGASGNPMSYLVVIQQPNGAPGLRTFAIMKEDFAEIGVELTSRVMDFGASFDHMFADEYSSFDIVFDDNDGPIDPNFILSSFLCSEFYNLNDAGWCNEEWDALYVQQAQAATPTERAEIVYEMQQLIYEDRPYVPIVNFDMISIASPRFTGFVPGPTRYIYHTSIQSLIEVHLAEPE